MKKIGFTLSEVLVTLGIIGVVAALTMPTLIQNGRNEANAAKLSVIVSSLENAFTTAITREGAETLFETGMWGNIPELQYKTDENGDVVVNSQGKPEILTGGLDGYSSSDAAKATFVGELNRYLVTAGYKNQNMTQYYESHNTNMYDMSSSGGQGSAIGADNGIGSGNQGFPILLKNGGVVFMRVYKKGTISANEDAVREAGGSFYEEAADVFIDVNGANPPNTVGRDLFTFYLGQNGILYPVGSMDVSVFDSVHEGKSANRTNIWSNPEGGWSCVTPNNINVGWGCTARLIEEGYKMNY